MQNAFLRIRDLSVQASSDYYTTEARTAMQNEVNSLIDQITMTKEGCNFNGVNLLASTSSSSAPTGFTQLTIDDFDNVSTQILEGVEFQKGEREGQTYYFIESADQLKVAANSGDSYSTRNKNFVFLEDIDLDGVSWSSNFGNDATIDGNGHVVKNYSSNSSALFTMNSSTGTIKNLGMENCSASGNYTVLLCNENNGTISGCYITDSTSSSNYSAVLCSQNRGSISDCYVTNLTVTGSDKGIFCYMTEGNISNSYAYNITTDSSVNCVKYLLDGEIANCYQNHNESDPDATYKDTEWFATDAAVSALGSAYELVEGKDHPTLKSNPEPAPAGSSALRIQTGFDGTTNSYLELDLGFDLGTITVDLSSATSAANSITTIDNYLTLLNDKQSIIGKDYNRLESAAQSNTLEIENMAGAKSIIVDADTAKENSEYIKTQILQNAATSLLAQTVNINSQIVLGLLTSL